MTELDDLLAEKPRPVADDGFTIRVMKRLPERRAAGAGNALWSLAGWGVAFLATFAMVAAGIDAGDGLSPGVLMLLAPIMAGFMAWIVAAEV